MNDQLPFLPSDYQIWQYIGGTSDSDVFLARCIKNNRLIAIKQYDLENSNISISRVIREITIYLSICHPNAIKYYQSFNFDSKIWILTECMNNGSLFDIIRNYFPNGIHDEILIATILQKTLLFFDYFHSREHIHRNFKLNKILLSVDGEIKICGFALTGSLIYNARRISYLRSITRFSKYSAPESFNDDKLNWNIRINQFADIWSLGITAIEIATGKTPFDGLELSEQMKQIKNFDLSKINICISEQFKDFLTKCLNKNPEKRCTAHDLLKHKFIKNSKDEKYIAKELNSKFPPLIERFNSYDINLKELEKSKDNNKVKKYEFIFTEPKIEINLSDFIFQNKIGKGSFGKVYKVKSKKDGNFYAAKVSRKSFENESSQEIMNLSREVDIISKLNHPSVLKFIFYSPFDFKGNPKPVIITELAQNESLDKLIQRKILNDTQKLIIIYGVASAMAYLHFHKILHRDLKPGNILLNEFLFPKIADFGLSKINHSNLESMTIKSMIGEIKGTPAYMAPEIWANGKYSEASDVYAFGIVVYEIITNENPYDHFNYIDFLLKIKNGFRPEFKTDINNSFKILIESCWSEKPSNRPSFSEITQMLRSDKKFIESSVDKQTYLNYVKYIDGCESSFNSKKNVFYFNFKSKLYYKNELNNIFLDEINDFKSLFIDFPYKNFIKLNDECKNLVKNAQSNASIQFKIGQSLIEGINQFPQNTQIGKHYLKKSFNNGYIDSMIYYCKMLIKGNILPQNLNKAMKIVQEKIKNKAINLYLLGKISKKKKDYVEAKKLFKESISLKNAEAMYEYGKMLFKEISSPSNKEKAIEYFLMSIDNDCPKAMFKYGLILMNKDEMKQEIETGIYYIKKAAEKGYVKAIFHYASILENGYGIQIDKIEAKRYYKEAAIKSYTKSMYKYALLTINSNSDVKEIDESLSILKNACNKGHIDSIYLYGMLFYKGINLHINQENAIRYIRIAANNGQDESMTLYGTMLANGDGVNSDKKEAIKYYKMAIDKGNSIAMFNYANMLFAGDGVPVNKEKAIKYFKISASKNNTDAIFKLVEMHYKGLKVFDNQKDKISMIKKAADIGDPVSMVKYADFISRGDEILSDKNEAIKYYQMAIDKGNIEAMLKCGIILYNDDKVPVNKEKGIQYIKFAADSGIQQARNVYDQVQKDIKNINIK